MMRRRSKKTSRAPQVSGASLSMSLADSSSLLWLMEDGQENAIGNVDAGSGNVNGNGNGSGRGNGNNRNFSRNRSHGHSSSSASSYKKFYRDLKLQVSNKSSESNFTRDPLGFQDKQLEEDPGAIGMGSLDINQTNANVNANATVGRLRFSENEQLLGRDRELEQIHSLFEQFVNQDAQENKDNSSFVISLSGTSGTGKTALAKQLKKDALDAEGFFCLGKFDINTQQGGAQPYMAFAEASSELAEQINKRNQPCEKKILCERIHNALGEQGIKLILQVFPGLADFLHPTSTSTATTETAAATTTETETSEAPKGQGTGTGTLPPTSENDSTPTSASTSTSTSTTTNIEHKTNQLHHTIRQLFRILSSKESPLVLVLDDVQWADTPSLNLVEALLTDREALFILVATYRSDEIHEDHPFFKKIDTLRHNLHQGKVHLQTIKIDNLDESAVRSLVANAMRESEDYVRSLAETVFEKTLGNPFFVLQFLQMLVNDELLTYNLGLMKWMWQEGDIQALSVADNVGAILARRIQNLSEPSTQMVLKVAACLGQGFEGETLLASLIALVEANLLQASTVETVNQGIRQCTESGLLEQSGSRYNFVHDQIKQTAFNLIPEDQLPKMQLEIGRGLLKFLSSEITNDNNDDIFFLAVDLCNRGSSLIDDKRMLIGLAWTNWEAADKAVQKSAFHAAISYANSGLQYLEDYQRPSGDGKHIQSLQLKLRVILAEASFCIGDSSAAEQYAELIIASDFTFNDRFDGYVTRMLSQFALQRLDEATNTSLFILRELGYVKNLPEKPGPLRVLVEIVKTKNLMKAYSQQDLMNLAPMTDTNRLRGINIIHQCSPVLLHANPNLFMALLLTAMRWTVKYGVSKYSPPIFSVYALVLCGVLEDFDNGMMIGEVALALSERLKATQTVAATTSVVFSFVYHWKKDLRSARNPLEHGLQMGLQAGDVNNVIAILIMLDQNSFMSGYHNLEELEGSFQENVAKIRALGHEAYAIQHCVVWQIVLNLQGKADDPFVLTGAAMNQEEVMKQATDTNHKMVFTSINSWSGIMGYLYDNHEFAVSRMKQVQYKDCLGYVSMPRHFSFLALAYAALALDGKKCKQNLRQARKIRNTMLRKWVAPGNVNIHHLVILVDAEIMALTTPDKASSLYEEAIQTATRAGFRNDKAAAHARAAHFFFSIQSDLRLGGFHLDRAVQAYCEWGALGVARNLVTKFRNVLDVLDPGTVGSGTVSSHGLSEEIRMSTEMRSILNESLGTN